MDTSNDSFAKLAAPGLPSMPAVQELAGRAGELTYRLRQQQDELLAHLASIWEMHRELQVTKEKLQNEGVIYTPDLPHFLLEALERYDQFVNMPHSPQPSAEY